MPLHATVRMLLSSSPHPTARCCPFLAHQQHRGRYIAHDSFLSLRAPIPGSALPFGSLVSQIQQGDLQGRLSISESKNTASIRYEEGQVLYGFNLDGVAGFR